MRVSSLDPISIDYSKYLPRSGSKGQTGEPIPFWLVFNFSISVEVMEAEDRETSPLNERPPPPL